METPKQKLLAAFLVTLVPCTARTVVILGLVAVFVNIWWALALYALDILLIIVLGRLAFTVVPGESVGLVMEMPDYHVPSLSVILKQTWARTRSLVWIVFPAYIIGSAVLQAVYAAGFLSPVNALLLPVTVLWLGLTAVIGITLVFGIVRKELTILTLAVIFGTTNFATVLSPVQLIVFHARDDALYPLYLRHPCARFGVRVEKSARDISASRSCWRLRLAGLRSGC